MASEVLDALSKYEWLEAARAALDLPASVDLRLLHLCTKTAHGDEDFQGFIGETAAVRARVAVGPEGKEEEAALFLKAVPRGNRVREALAVGTCAFHKEVGFFELLRRLLPRLRPAPAPAPFAPRCLLAQPRWLVFEDLAAQGYRTLGLRSTLDFAHCAAALEALARLHAASLAVEEADRRARNLTPWRLGERFPDALHEAMFSDTVSNILTQYIASAVGPVQALVGLMPRYKDSARFQQILRRTEQFPRIAAALVKPSTACRNVLCHGDVWVNNIMFRYSSWGQVEEARLVDFQLTRYAPPSLDVEMLLHMCTRRPLRDAHAQQLRDTYYTALERALASAGFQAQELLPRADFDASLATGAAFARIATACYFPGDQLPAAILGPVMDSEDALERYMVQERTQYVRAAWAQDADYRDRVGEVVEELVDGLLLAEDHLFTGNA